MIAASSELAVELSDGQMPLNNGGDEVELLNADGDLVDFVSYSGGPSVVRWGNQFRSVSVLVSLRDVPFLTQNSDG